MNPIFDDPTPRYAPEMMISASAARQPVTRWVVHPAGQHAGPIRSDVTAVECVLADGSRRWFGCESAHINSELRLVVVGHPSRDEVRRNWEVTR